MTRGVGRRGRRALTWAITLAATLMLWGPAPAAAQDARVTTEVDTTLVTVGDRIRLSVAVDHAAGAQVVWPDSIDLAPFEVLAAEVVPPVTRSGRSRSGLVLTLAAFELGELEIPSFEFSVDGPGDVTQSLSSDRFGVEVVSVGQDESGDIRDIRGPLSIPVGIMTIAIWLLALLVLALLGWWLTRRWRNRPSAPDPVPALPPRSADEVALEALARIEASDLLTRGEVKEYHIAVSDVLRRYVEARFEVPALEMTTAEVMGGLARVGVADGVRDGLRRFLDPCDLVKFAKVRPDAEASRAVLELGRELVRASGPAPAGPAQTPPQDTQPPETAPQETPPAETPPEETPPERVMEEAT